MKLVIEKMDYRLYAYVCSERHFKKIDKEFGKSKRLPRKILNEECDLGFLPNNSHIVFDIADKPKKRKSAKKRCLAK